MMYVDDPPQIIDCVAQAEHEQAVGAALDEIGAARLAGDFAAARCALERLLSSEPQNADAWVQLGLVHSASGDAPRARAAFLRALDIAPDYDDAKLGLARLAYRSGDLESARAWLQRINPARLGDPEIDAFRVSLEAMQAGRAVWRWDAFAAYSTLSEDLAPWREASWSVSRRKGASSVGAGVEYVERFDRSDIYGEVRLAWVIRGGTWGVALGGASGPNFKPEAAVRVEYATREDEDWVFGGSMTIARYRVGQIDRFGLRAERNLGDGVRVNAQAIAVRDEAEELRTGYGLGGAWRLDNRLELSLAWSDAPESSEGATIDVRSLGFAVAVDAASDLRLRVGILQEERDAFDRVEFAFSVARTF
jgi:YaiO family outer membrane protein